jgi:hypothetical protein
MEQWVLAIRSFTELLANFVVRVLCRLYGRMQGWNNGIVTSKERKEYSKRFLFLWPIIPAIHNSNIPRLSTANGFGFKWRKLNKITYKVKPFVI